MAAGDAPLFARMLTAEPALARARFVRGATRQGGGDFFVPAAGQCLYAGDTALHMAAALYRLDFVTALLAAGADA